MALLSSALCTLLIASFLSSTEDDFLLIRIKTNYEEALDLVAGAIIGHRFTLLDFTFWQEGFNFEREFDYEALFLCTNNFRIGSCAFCINLSKLIPRVRVNLLVPKGDAAL